MPQSEERASPKFWRVFLFTAIPALVALGVVVGTLTLGKEWTPSKVAWSAVVIACGVLLLPLLPTVLASLLIGVVVQFFGIELPGITDIQALMLFLAAIPISASLNWLIMRSIHRRVNGSKAPPESAR